MTNFDILKFILHGFISVQINAFAIFNQLPKKTINTQVQNSTYEATTTKPLRTQHMKNQMN